MEIVPGPDFPTGGIILGRSGIRAAYATGRGRLKVRSKTDIEEMENGRSRIIVTEIPYMVNKSALVESIGNLVKDKRIEGITDIRDESNRKGIRIVVDLSRTANAQVVLNQLFHLTKLQDTFAVNMLALVDNVPKVLSLKDALMHYVEHQRSVVIKRTEFDLRKALDRAHILQGLRIAVDNIDEVVSIIRSSPNVPEAKAALMERFSAADVKNMLAAAGVDDIVESTQGLSDAQATAIVSMTLGQLTGLGVDKIEKEFVEKADIIRDCRAILADEARIRGIIKDELLDIKKRLGDGRRTQIEDIEGEIDIEDLIKEETCVYTLTKLGYIKRMPADAYRAQRRGGRGVSGLTTREEDVADTLFVGSSHDNILFFTTRGRVFRLKGYRIPEAGRTAKGTNIVNLLQLDPEERVTSMQRVDGFTDEYYLTTVTEKGIVKRLRLPELANIRRNGIRAQGLDEDDRLVSVMLTTGGSDILIGTRSGLAVCFNEQKVRPMGRTARGVIGIRLEQGDRVMGACTPQKGQLVLTVTENGYGKLTPESDFPRHNRGGKGVVLHNVTAKSGPVAALTVSDGSEDILLITSEGTVIRTAADSLRICGRGSQGVIVMRTGEGERVVTLAKTEREEDDEQDDVDNSVENVEESVDKLLTNGEEDADV
jgi:DNA gyrase subunit A